MYGVIVSASTGAANRLYLGDELLWPDDPDLRNHVGERFELGGGDTNYGYNAQTEEFGDLVEMGIIDPAKVVRVALQNAASVAGLMITTEAMIAPVPEEKKAAAPEYPPM